MRSSVVWIFNGVLLIQGQSWAQPVISFTPSEICRAAIATVFSQDPAIVKVDRSANGVVFLHYNRPSDGKYWDNRCRIEGKRIIWASAEGRWRIHPMDEVIEFTINKNEISIEERYGDGSKTVKTFTKSQLSK